MALRSKTAACLIFAGLLSASELKYPVRHEHLRKGGEGVLTFTEQSVWFEESGKKSSHSRKWTLDDIQELELSPDRMRIRTYEDVRRQFGRDLEYRFDHLPKELAGEVYGLLASRMDQRLIARVAGPGASLLWSIPAKMLRGTSGSNGLLKIGEDRIVFASAKDSRTWRFSDIEGITSENPFELTISSLDRDTRIQLKRRLSEDRYNELWHRVSEANGLTTFHSSLETHHD